LLFIYVKDISELLKFSYVIVTKVLYNSEFDVKFMLLRGTKKRALSALFCCGF